MAKHIEIAGGLPPDNAGEARVLKALIEGLPENYRIFSNVQVAAERGRIDDCDLIVIAPRAVVIVEVKDLRGIVIVGERSFSVDGEERSNPIVVTEFKAKRLSSRLHKTHTINDVYVAALVVLAQKPKQLNVYSGYKDTILSIENLIERLLDADTFGPNRPEALARFPAIQGALSLQPRKLPQVFGPYRARRVISQSSDEEQFEGVHSLTGEEVRIRRVLFPMLADHEENRRRREEAVRSIQAFNRVEDTSCIAPAGELMEMDDGALVIVTRGNPTITLRESMLGDENFDESFRLNVLANVSSAVASLGRAGIAHRTISPDVIEISKEGNARLGGLGSSRFGKSTGKTVVLNDLDIDFVAPEVIENPGEADHRADLWALGSLIEWLWPEADFEDRPSPIGEPPRGLSELIASLHHDDPSRRGPAASEVMLAALGAAGPDEPEEVPEWPPTIIDTFEIREQIMEEPHPAFIAYDVATNALCFLKIYPHEDGLSSVRRQFQALQSAKGSNIVEARHAGLSPYGAYLVTELLPSPDLRAMIDAGVRYQPAEALRMVEDLARALNRLHMTAGSAHGDVKPENLFALDKSLILVDFDLCGVDSSILGGTAGYIPPGGARTIDADRDLYATAIVLHELLTGVRPTLGVDRSVPKPIERLLNRALSAERSERFTDGAAMAEALAHAGRTLNGVTVGQVTFELHESGIEEGLTTPSGEEVTAANTTTYRVSNRTGALVDVTVFDEVDGEAMWIQATGALLAEAPLIHIVNRLRMTINKASEDRLWMEVRVARERPGQRPTAVKTSEADLRDILGIDIQGLLSDIPGIRFGSRQSVLGDDGRRRMEFCVEFDDLSGPALMTTFVIARVLPLLQNRADPTA